MSARFTGDPDAIKTRCPLVAPSLPLIKGSPMALIRWPEGQQRSGSIGGSTYSHNRFGAYVRARTIPVNPNTQRQVDVRNLMQNLTIQWGTVLTQLQRDAWDLYASNITWFNALSEAVFLSGLNHYIRSNVPRMMCGLEKLQDAPCEMYLAIPEQQLIVTGSFATQLLSVAYDDTAAWASETGGFQIVYMGKPVSPAKKFFNGPWRKICCILGEDPVAIAVQDGNGKGNGKGKKVNGKSAKVKAPGNPGVLAPPTSPEDCPTAYPFCDGARIWVRTRIGRADGRLSDFAEYTFLAGP